MTNEAFVAGNGFKVPDGTYVFPFLNSNDALSGLPHGLLDSFSLAIGEIEAGVSSSIHVHPVVAQVTMVLEGRLEVRLKDDTAEAPYSVHLAQHQAVLVRPRGFVQLINASRFPCRTLYIVGPSYVFDVGENGEVLYDDALVINESWKDLEALGWEPPGLPSADVANHGRVTALDRMRSRAPG